MEILDKNAGYLSNFEVLQVVKEVNIELSVIKNKFSNEHMFTNTENVEKFLAEGPSAQQTPEKIKSFLQTLAKFKLKPSEKLQILNTCPMKPVDLHILVEECDTRFSDDEVEKILELVQEHFCEDAMMS
ncbi:DNA-directed RNA polymerase III subunit RPC9 [Oopsacas minuta]|uniref:DNA-directed RNA polymerase III subunit RPC9 n=1 Tax=Oopsacas minuta TaxID=111878 RepID=A0AAV7KIM5_9METZ|nr:DNA-directed RNA polymerase III subunit RPC9 [Oopsacas minuta]